MTSLHAMEYMQLCVCRDAGNDSNIEKKEKNEYRQRNKKMNVGCVVMCCYLNRATDSLANNCACERARACTKVYIYLSCCRHVTLFGRFLFHLINKSVICDSRHNKPQHKNGIIPMNTM